MRGRFTAALLLALCAPCMQPAEARAVLAPVPARVAKESDGLKRAVFAGRCFWGVEGVFSHVKGVTSAVSGFHGGSGKTAKYDRVKQGDTGHAEAVEVTYDPRVVRYDQLLRIYFSVIADPTQLNRQGPDTGTQYRTALVPVTEEQRLVASAYIAQLRASGLWKRPIVTRLESLDRFYPAEAEHQDFMAVNPKHPYIVTWDVAKVRALKKLFPALYKPGFTKG